jgi:outer membrane protein assembly factor BamB
MTKVSRNQNLPRRVVWIALLGLILESNAIAENWPQFRGPDNQGVSVEKSAPLSWSPTENIQWKVEIPGEGWSSPIVWGNHIFVTTATNNGVSCRVLCIDRQTGAIQWNNEVMEQKLDRKEERNTYATPTPATDGTNLFVCFGDGSFAALDIHGDTRWSNRDYPHYSQHGLGTSPILRNGMLIMARDGSSNGDDKTLGWQKPWDKSYVVSLEASTGKQKWLSKRGPSRISHGAPTIWKHGDMTQVISEAGDLVQGFDLESGKLIWTSEVLGEGKVPSTIVGDGVVFTAGGWGGKESIKAFRIGAVGELKESNLVWEQKKGMPKVPSMLFVAPHLYAITDNGVATCYDAASGEIQWQHRIGGNFSASPIAAADRIYITDDDGSTTVIAAGAEYKELARNELKERVQASAAISNGQIFIRTERHLHCIGKTE